MRVKILGKIYDFLNEEHAATAVEYAVMIAFIAAVVIVNVTLLGVKTTGLLSDFNNSFNPP